MTGDFGSLHRHDFVRIGFLFWDLRAGSAAEALTARLASPAAGRTRQQLVAAARRAAAASAQLRETRRPTRRPLHMLDDFRQSVQRERDYTWAHRLPPCYVGQCLIDLLTAHGTFGHVLATRSAFNSSIFWSGPSSVAMPFRCVLFRPAAVDFHFVEQAGAGGVDLRGRAARSHRL